MKILKDSLTAEYINEIIKKVREEYVINNKIKYSLTTDNGSNLISATD